MSPAGSQGLLQFNPAHPPATLRLDELQNRRVAASPVEEPPDGFPLCLDARRHLRDHLAARRTQGAPGSFIRARGGPTGDCRTHLPAPPA
jgi:hypothetical protein